MVVGRLSLGHLDGGDAQGPDVHLVVIIHATDKFGSHPEGSTYHTLPLSFLLGESNCKAKIRELDFSLRVQKDVVTLDISMESVVGVEVDEGLQHVLAHVGDVLFIPLDGWEQEVGEGACVHQLHCNPQLVLPQVTVIDSDDIGVVGSSLKCELVLDVLDA